MRQKSVYEAIRSDGRFTVLAKILEGSGIGPAMATEEQKFTFFAPTDAAFERLPKQTVDRLMSPRWYELLTTFLGEHLVPKSYFHHDDLLRKGSVVTLNGTTLRVVADENALHLGRARVLTPGIPTGNGVVFPVEDVLFETP